MRKPALHSTLAALLAPGLLFAGTANAGQTVAVPGWFQIPAGPAPPAPQVPGPGPGGAPTPVPPDAGMIAGAGETLEVVPLKYADISEIVGILTGNQSVRPTDDFAPQEPNYGSNGASGYFGGSGLPTGPVLITSVAPTPNGESLGRAIDGSIGVDRRLNAIVLRGSPERIAAIKRQIEVLDVPVTSVVLEIEFVELSETGARNLGLDFNNGSGQIGTVALAYSKGYPGTPDTPRLGGVTGAFQVALYAQISKGEGRIVSKPRISAQSGSTAKIVTGDALPILTSIALSGVNAVQQQVQYVNVGVTLQIAPRVSTDGFVTAQMFAVVSSVTGFSQGYPTISQREATTSATVRDGETFVIGGLTQESRITNKSKVPILGSLPVLGTLFTVDHSSKTKHDLYIVVTPHIVRPASK